MDWWDPRKSLAEQGFSAQAPEAKPVKPPPAVRQRTQCDCSNCVQRRERGDKWEARRVQLLPRLAEGAGPVPPDQRHAFFVVGLPGAGKSVHVEEHLLPLLPLRHLDPDRVKPWLPDYQPRNPETVHDESRDLVKRAARQAIEDGAPFVFVTTGGGADTLLNLSSIAQDQGFTTHLHWVQCPLEVALARAQVRERVVPEEIIRERADNILAVVDHLRKSGQFDHYVEWNNQDHAAELAPVEYGSPEWIAWTCY